MTEDSAVPGEDLLGESSLDAAEDDGSAALAEATDATGDETADEDPQATSKIIG
ncbi:hypothetical protein GTR02_10510 [Kineococcus sp. R8]|uniref:hypothetical protein n=1 Tax=Kineococcus siccus TaxID=2696567 RepID=UPI001411E4C3|nr:hypothetical protein [Kineococcus siccus]NAZ82249.1 hypothetical protein [Kineococcus siccus]